MSYAKILLDIRDGDAGRVPWICSGKSAVRY